MDGGFLLCNEKERGKMDLPHFQDIHDSGKNFKLNDEQIRYLQSMIDNYKDKGLDVHCSDVIRTLGNQEWEER